MVFKAGMRARSSMALARARRQLKELEKKKKTQEKIQEKKKPKVHDGIICDKCDGEISGYRYKCKECADFDLCFKCKQDGNHSRHDFLRISSN